MVARSIPTGARMGRSPRAPYGKERSCRWTPCRVFFPATVMPDRGLVAGALASPRQGRSAAWFARRGGGRLTYVAGTACSRVPIGGGGEPRYRPRSRSGDARCGAGAAGRCWAVRRRVDCRRRLCRVADLVGGSVDFVLMANTFHGVPDQPRLAAAVRWVLGSGGLFAVVNWHKRPREATPVLGQARGPKTEMRMAPADVAAVVEPTGLRLASVVELPPYHYGAVFERPHAG